MRLSPASLFGFVLTLAVAGGMAVALRATAPAGPPPLASTGHRPAGVAASCRFAGRLENVGYTLPELGQAAPPTRLRASRGGLLLVHGGVPVSWVGFPVYACPARGDAPAQVCIGTVCVRQVPGKEKPAG